MALLFLIAAVFFLCGVIEIYRVEKEIAWDFAGGFFASLVATVLFAGVFA